MILTLDEILQQMASAGKLLLTLHSLPSQELTNKTIKKFSKEVGDSKSSILGCVGSIPTFGTHSKPVVIKSDLEYDEKLIKKFAQQPEWQ